MPADLHAATPPLPPLLQCATQWGLFLMFAGCTAVGSIALWMLVPETRGLPIEQVHLAWCQHWLWGGIQCVRERTAGPGVAAICGVAEGVRPSSGASLAEGCQVAVDIPQPSGSAKGQC